MAKKKLLDSSFHNPKVAGSNPAPATKKNKKPVSQEAGFFVSRHNNLSGLLSKISKLSPTDIQLLGSLMQSKLIKMGGRMVHHARRIIFQLSEAFR